MRRTLLTASALVASPALWVVAASALWCRGADGNWHRFVFPYRQWIDLLPYWRTNWWVTFWFVVSALVPIIWMIIVVIIACIALKGNPNDNKKALYGKTGFANPDHMRKNGMSLKKDAFN
jgi:hypothetical protein